MCVKAAGLVQKHVKVGHEGEDPNMSTVSLDYFYMGETEGAKPNIVARDWETGLMAATSIKTKGLVDATAQKMMTRFLESLGYKEVVLKIDGEGSLVKMNGGSEEGERIDESSARGIASRRFTLGDPLTRKSVTVIKNGGRTVMARGVSQKIVALSSCESECWNVLAFYMGEKVPVVKMLVDSSAAKAMLERKGVRKTRHVQARFLWLQDRVEEKELKVEKTPGAVNDADIVTKVQTGGILRSHLARLGYELSDSTGHKALFF